MHGLHSLNCGCKDTIITLTNKHNLIIFKAKSRERQAASGRLQATSRKR